MILIVGSAPCYERDLFEARALFPDAAIMAVNHTGLHIRSDYWASVHTDELICLARDIGYTGRLLTTGDTGVPNVGGTSALFAAQVSVRVLGEAALLCGVPLQGTSSLSTPHSTDYESRVVRIAWHGCQEIRGKVWSMSGWTRDLLGGPENAH